MVIFGTMHQHKLLLARRSVVELIETQKRGVYEYIVYKSEILPLEFLSC